MNSVAYELHPTNQEFLAQPNILAEQEFIALELRHQDEITFVARRAEQLARETAHQMQEDFWHSDVVRDYTPNDTLGYQRRYIALEESAASEFVLKEAAEARKHNVRVGFGEAMQALTWDLPEPRCYLQSADGTLHDGGYEIGSMFYNALSPLNGEVELERRIYEAANFRAIEQAGRIEELAKNAAFVEISMRNTERGASGYVEEIDKLQIRYSKFVDTPRGRELVMQPMYLDGRLFDEHFMNGFLESLGVSTQGGKLDRTEILSKPIMVDASQIRDVVDFVAIMDEAASEWHGKDIFVGEVVEQNTAKNYSGLAAISKQRYAMIEDAVTHIDAEALKMARQGAEPAEASVMLDALQKRVALQICRTNPGVASIAFDSTTEQLLMQANVLEAEGRQSEADSMFDLAVEVAPDLRGCGAACSIREANLDERVKAMRSGLKEYDLSGKFYFDGEANCPACGRKGILRGGNGAVCANKQCQSSNVNGVVKVKNQEEESRKSDKKKLKWWKTIAEVEAEARKSQQ
jgi:hypothetical protein